MRRVLVSDNMKIASDRWHWIVYKSVLIWCSIEYLEMNKRECYQSKYCDLCLQRPYALRAPMLLNSFSYWIGDKAHTFTVKHFTEALTVDTHFINGKVPWPIWNYAKVFDIHYNCQCLLRNPDPEQYLMLTQQIHQMNTTKEVSRHSALMKHYLCSVHYPHHFPVRVPLVLWTMVGINL